MHPPEKDATTIGELHGVRISKFETGPSDGSSTMGLRLRGPAHRPGSSTAAIQATTIGELHGVRISKFEIHEPERSFITDVKVEHPDSSTRPVIRYIDPDDKTCRMQLTEQYINRHIQDRNRKAMLANPLRLGWR